MSRQTTRDRIASILSNRKTGIASETIAKRINAPEKTVRNVLGQMLNEGKADYDEWMQVNSRGNSVLGYVQS